MIVKADPYGSDDARAIAGEPCVFRAVGCTGFAADIATFKVTRRTPAGTHPAGFAEDIGVQRAFNQKRQRCIDHMRRVLLRAVLRDQRLVCLFQLRHRYGAVLLLLRNRDLFHIGVFQHVGFLRIAVNDRDIALRAGDFRFRFEDHAALIVLNLADEIRVDQETAVRHHRITARNLHRREGGGAQRQRFGMHDILRREAEALQILRRIVDAHGAHGAYHHHVFRLPQPLA
ncbi:Uncharacterised protein [Salmonella enterica subsp. enterica serovar Bovismorbificans]|nr:Uncharacterised protein [Salmonella enterica subsp. enterica serovar Bovismorbificans]CNT96661.1 Uncharacterised protein [Salmonella enterica subsp. enterica serovar Bovismorbificans]CNU31971.1 Uncharacterised protein [Salmonella enterica subsp. enterica serovar Bovismorbificans]CNU42189.1 Uncharacterised protein [Salmonella enterica subsp. enterica serovar Bovismorbificans]CPR44692.1 Uncharacterised protein [Salmonella enterica subsp. enterica serovar Bovismorbificans]